MNLDQLIKSCIKKNRGAQETLYTLYEKKLFPVCLKYCRSYAEAEDHLHDVFIEIFENIQKYKSKGSFEGWIKRIAINKAIDKYKKNTVFDLKDFEEEKITEEITIVEDDLPPSFERLIQLIQQLPDQYRIVFSMYELDGYSHKEISKSLRISEGTSKSNLHRAKAILKNRIIQFKKGAKQIKKSHES
ncbi:RNA polymerase sigma factor [Ulvibacterium marinum]|uniref:RNA polymerase sigma factor n=1 Tax=Ulvibacterium marinum TaxID=2419782 RepID=UPI00249417F4|nr:RNA polymerase sigma factor [Ulvibacterium marinum]